MKLIWIFVFVLLNIYRFVNGKSNYIPVLLWSSPKIPDWPVLTLNKINKDLFSNYLTEKLSNKKSLVVVFTEKNFNVDDFNKFNTNPQAVLPFLGSSKEKITFFPQVETPLESITKLKRHGYKWKQMNWDWSVKDEETPSVIVIDVECANDESREEKQRVMAVVTERLKNSDTDWICLYTGDGAADNNFNWNRRKKELFDRLQMAETTKSGSSVVNEWHVEPEPAATFKPLYLYKDNVRGLALLTRGPIQLYLPTHRNHTVRALDNYTDASFIRSDDTMDLVVVFKKYTLTFCMSLIRKNWIIVSVNIQNDNGQTMKLWPKSQGCNMENARERCRKINEFQSKGKPFLKVELSKYKVVQLNEDGDVCVNIFTVPVLCTIISMSILFTALLWSAILRIYKVPPTSKANNISIPFDLLSLKESASKTDLKS